MTPLSGVFHYIADNNITDDNYGGNDNHSCDFTPSLFSDMLMEMLVMMIYIMIMNCIFDVARDCDIAVAAMAEDDDYHIS